MSDLTCRKDQMKEKFISKVKEAQVAIFDSIILPEERDKVTKESEDQDDPKQTFYVTVPTQDNKLIQIMTNPVQYKVIESDKFSFNGCRTVYVEPNLYAFSGESSKLEVW